MLTVFFQSILCLVFLFVFLFKSMFKSPLFLFFVFYFSFFFLPSWGVPFCVGQSVSPSEYVMNKVAKCGKKGQLRHWSIFFCSSLTKSERTEELEFDALKIEPVCVCVCVCVCVLSLIHI